MAAAAASTAAAGAGFVGKRFPAVTLYEGTPAGAVPLADLLAGKKVVVFGLPGAYTPGCSKSHLPGYIASHAAFTAKGVSSVICTSVNDPFVMAAWGAANGAEGKVRMLADTNAELARALGVDMEIAALGGVRSKRYSAVVEDGVITAFNLEPEGTGLTCSLAPVILADLK